LRAASTSEGIYSLLGAIAQRLGVRVSRRARPCLRAWSIQMDCSVCRSACGLRRREKNESGERGRFACVVERNARRFERPPGAGDTRGYPRHRVHTRHAYARHRASPMVHARSDVFRIHSSRDRNLFASKLWTTRPGNRSLTSERLKAHTKKNVYKSYQTCFQNGII
jgi:hypothetical protein